MKQIPKIIGSDSELGNFLLGVARPSGTGREASRLLLKHMPGEMPAYSFGGYNIGGAWEPPDPTDFGRKWMTNGGCSYIDSDHLEICTPETTNAWDWVAAYYAQLENVRGAQQRASEELAEESSLQVLVCNSDGRGNSWGSHLNFLITRRAFLNIFERRMHHLLWLASYQASSVIVSGQGKAGCEREGFNVDYQISQRADFFEEIVSINTMLHRPIINSRDESHCFPPADFARFHHIACDANLCPVANLIKVGVLQIMLAMVEAESDLVSPSMLLESPVDALVAFSHDTSLTVKARTIDGELMSALEMQRRYFDAASRFYAAGGCDGIVPRADEILAYWGETLDMLASSDDRLVGRLDWVLKKKVLEQAFQTNPGINWQSPEAKYMDLQYSNLNPDEGLFWPYLDAGVVQQVVDPRQIETFKSLPPIDTRAFTRGHMIRGRGDYQIEGANWDNLRIRFNAASARGQVLTMYMDSPEGSTLRDNPSLPQKGTIHLANIPTDFQPVRHTNNKGTSTWNKENFQSICPRK